MHTAIRSVLDCLGKKARRGSGISVLLAVAEVLYAGCDELLQDARDRYKIRQQEGKEPRTSTTNAPGGIDNPHAPRTPQSRGGDREAELSVKRSQSMSSRFRDSEKYSSDIDDPTTLRKTRERFSCACKELGIPREEQAGLLHHVLKGAAHDFYFGEMQSHIPNGTPISLQEAYTLLSEKYETRERQQQVRTNLQSLRLSAIQQLEACDKLKALTFAYNKISKFIHSCPPGFTGEEHMIDIMCTKVLAEEEWAEDVCTRRLTDDTLTFANLYAKLSATLCEKVSKGRIENFSTATTTPSTYRTSIPFGVYYGAKYASTSRPNKSSRSPRVDKSTLSYTPTRELVRQSRLTDPCRRCGKLGHFIAECRQPAITVNQALAARVRESNGNVASVLFEFGCEMEEIEAGKDLHHDEIAEHENTEDAAQNIFEQFVALDIGGSEQTEDFQMPEEN
jgi:hypothetical protein